MDRLNDALPRYALAVLAHIALVVVWYLFVKLGDVPKFVMPSPLETLDALRLFDPEAFVDGLLPDAIG